MISLGFVISAVLATLQLMGLIHIGYLACAYPLLVGLGLTLFVFIFSAFFILGCAILSVIFNK